MVGTIIIGKNSIKLKLKNSTLFQNFYSFELTAHSQSHIRSHDHVVIHVRISYSVVYMALMRYLELMMRKDKAIGVSLHAITVARYVV